MGDQRGYWDKVAHEKSFTLPFDHRNFRILPSINIKPTNSRTAPAMVLMVRISPNIMIPRREAVTGTRNVTSSTFVGPAVASTL